MRLGRRATPVFADLIFTTTRGEPINEEYLVKKHFKPLLREAGLPNIRLYDLRHTSATLASNGWSRAEGSVRATWTCERRVHPGHLLARASAYAGRSCCQDGSSPAEWPFVVTRFPV